MFWRHELVRLKFHNPAIPMSVDRTAAQTDPALLSVHYTNPDAVQSSSSATSAPAARDSTTKNTTPSDASSTERVETINMTHSNNTEILEAFVRLTKAYPVEGTAIATLLVASRLKDERISIPSAAGCFVGFGVLSCVASLGLLKFALDWLGTAAVVLTVIAGAASAAILVAGGAI